MMSKASGTNYVATGKPRQALEMFNKPLTVSL